MTFLERLVVKLAARVDGQLDALSDRKAFEAAQDAMIAKNYSVALKGFEELAMRGHGRAAALAGTMHLMGEAVRENGAQAIKYLTIGAKANDPAAISLLGMAFAAGKAGVKVDYFKARPLLEQAVKNGDAKAKEMLEIVLSKQKGKR